MDKERQIRFLYPPIILLGWLLLGFVFDDHKSFSNLVQVLKSVTTKEMIAWIAGGGLIVIVLGYLIGTLTLSFLRIIFIKRRGSYEISKKTNYEEIKKVIFKDNSDISDKERLFLVVTYDHEFLPIAIHKWLQRRWQSFNTAANSVTAIILSMIIGKMLCIKITSCWLILSVIFVLMLWYQAYRMREETIKMIEFQLKVKDEHKSN